MAWLRVLLLALTVGTASLVAQAQPAAEITAADIYAAEQNARGALQAGDTAPANDRVEAYLGAIEGFAYDANFLGDWSRGPTDAFVEQLYEEARRIAPAEMRGKVDYVMGNYLNTVNRTGRAKELLQSALSDPVFSVNPEDEFYALVQVAAAYLDQGQASNADIILNRAKAAIVRMPPAKRNEARLKMTPMEMSLRIAQGNPSAVRALWDEESEILKDRHLAKITKRQAAGAAIFYLNQISDRDRAKEAERITRANLGGRERIDGLRGLTQNDVDNLVVDCMQVLYSGDPVSLAADPSYKDAFDLCLDLGMDLPAMQGQMQIAPARVFELKGENNRALELYEKAIEVAEAARGSFDTGERSEFFTGRWRPAYAGILRIHAREAASSPTAYYAFTLAMIAAERSRARQFGDLTGDNASFTGSKEMLDFLRSLPKGTAVVVQTSQDDELVVMSYFGGRYAAAVLPISANQLDIRVSQVQALISDPASDVEEVERAVDGLSRDTLGPTRALLKDATHIIVLADGALTRFPFGLFTVTDGGDPLAVSADITYALSLRSLRSPVAASDATGFFGAGDPAFPAIRPAPGFTQSQMFETARSAAAIRIEGETALFSPLHYSRREVSEIATTFDAGAADKLADGQALEFASAAVRVVLGQQASETQAKMAIPSARYLHFATHGLIAGELGVSESAVVLAPSSEDDGYLTASEVERLKISAVLAVLSACNTGNGRVVAGEGVIGLARSFLLAGSQSALVSLWSIDDASTTAFMIDFYGRLQGGLTPAAALRETITEMRGLYDHPAHWAAFILISR